MAEVVRLLSDANPFLTKKVEAGYSSHNHDSSSLLREGHARK